MNLPEEQLEPIMTKSDNIVSFGMNAYAKPATGLWLLRETIMGRELFDEAFKTYCERWAFKHPTPADLFRTFEDVSAMDLDWFWRGWFFGIEKVDIALDTVEYYQADLENDPPKKTVTREERREKPFDDIAKKRDREEGIEFAVEQDPELVDYYTTYRPWETEDSVQTVTTHLYEETLTKKEKKEKYGNKHYYQLSFTNKGGLVMPIFIEWTYEDGTTEVERVPVEIWRKNEQAVTKVFVKDKKVSAIRLDPYRQTADVDETNNTAPVPQTPTLFKVFKGHKVDELPNPMQKAKIKP